MEIEVEPFGWVARSSAADPAELDITQEDDESNQTPEIPQIHVAV
jgi:hypothetical protein